MTRSALRHHQRRPQPGRQPADPVPGRPLARAGRVDLLRRPPADRRTRFLVACATACLAVFPFVGTIVYSILRPPEFLADKRERELEIRASELRVRQLEEASCPNCEHPVERSFLRCPNCRARIKDPCESCGKPIDPRWSICPYCETPLRRAAPPERGRRRSAAEGARPSEAGSQPRDAAPQPRSARSRSAPSSGASSGRPPPARRAPTASRTHAASRARPEPRSSSRPSRSRTERSGDVAAPRARRVGCRADGGDSRTLILIKPDAFERGLTGEILARFERKGLRITAAAAADRATRRSPTAHYDEHTEKPFFGELVSFITGGPLVAAVLEGHEAVDGRPPADRSHQPDRGRDRARSAATTGSRSPSTSSTAPTPMSPPSARSGSGSASSTRA